MSRAAEIAAKEDPPTAEQMEIIETFIEDWGQHPVDNILDEGDDLTRDEKDRFWVNRARKFGGAD